MDSFIIDTNFILRYLLADNENQFKQAKALFDQARNGKVHLKLEQIVFVETIFVLSSFYEVPKEKIIEIMDNLLLYKGLETDKALLSTALKIYNQHNMHIVDSILAAKSQIDNIKLLSFDKKLNQVVKS
jgi:predicted nucleic-acid-binding protein